MENENNTQQTAATEEKTKFCKHCAAKFPRMPLYVHLAEDRLKKLKSRANNPTL